MRISGLNKNSKNLKNLNDDQIISGDLGGLRMAIDRGDVFYDEKGQEIQLSYGSIISDNTAFTDSIKTSNPVTTTQRTGGLTLIGGFNRVTFPSLNGTGNQLYICSNSANDTAAGTGAREIFIQYINNDWDEATTTVTMNGTTPVALPVDNVYRVNRMQISSVGSLKRNNGMISISTVNDFSSGVPQTDIVNAIDAGYSYSAVSIYSVPSNTRMYFTRGSFYSDAVQGKSLRQIQYSTFPFDSSTPDVNRIQWFVGDLSISANAAYNTSGSAPEFPCTDIEFTVASANNTINGSIFWNTTRVRNKNRF